jgi:predicted anti-sigma-YlaC factor YlaD
MLDRALALNESWDAGALHEFKVLFAGSKPGGTDATVIRKHYDRALELSKGFRAGLYLAYAEAVAVPAQDKREFQMLIERALAIDPDAVPQERLTTLLAQRRARWLMTRLDDLILDDGASKPSGGR